LAIFSGETLRRSSRGEANRFAVPIQDISFIQLDKVNYFFQVGRQRAL
jgi:hypothetical protein